MPFFTVPHSLKGVSFARRFFMPLRPRTLLLFSAFSPAGPKGCSKDDERVLKGCLCLCHPSQKLFFRRKHLHGAILFPKFSAKIQQIFEIYKDFSNKMQFYLYFVQQSLVICTTVRLYLRRIPYLQAYRSNNRPINIEFYSIQRK